MFGKKYYLKKDGLLKSRKTPLSVIPAKAGIQFIQLVTKALDSGFHRSDDFLRDYQEKACVKNMLTKCINVV